jgi:predicted RNase H-like HicB family nuclease
MTNKTLRYLAVYEHRKDGYSGFVPDLPGCISSGKTLEMMQCGIRTAVDAFIAERTNHGEEMPPSVTRIVHFPRPREGHGIDHWVVEGVEVLFSKSGRAIQTEKAGQWPAKR